MASVTKPFEQNNGIIITITIEGLGGEKKDV